MEKITPQANYSLQYYDVCSLKTYKILEKANFFQSNSKFAENVVLGQPKLFMNIQKKCKSQLFSE